MNRKWIFCIPPLLLFTSRVTCFHCWYLWAFDRSVKLRARVEWYSNIEGESFGFAVMWTFCRHLSIVMDWSHDRKMYNGKLLLDDSKNDYNRSISRLNYSRQWNYYNLHRWIFVIKQKSFQIFVRMIFQKSDVERKYGVKRQAFNSWPTEVDQINAHIERSTFGTSRKRIHFPEFLRGIELIAMASTEEIRSNPNNRQHPHRPIERKPINLLQKSAWSISSTTTDDSNASSHCMTSNADPWMENVDPLHWLLLRRGKMTCRLL